MQTVFVPRLVDEVFETYLPLASEAELELELVVDGSFPEQAGDPLRLHQALGNLIGNALKFSRPHGHVVVKLSRTSSETVLSVSDSGPGIGPELQSRLFDRFWQAKSADHRGAGLGLSIAKAIVERHGGRIWVESTPGLGSTFSFSLPLQGPSASSS